MTLKKETKQAAALSVSVKIHSSDNASTVSLETPISNFSLQRCACSPRSHLLVPYMHPPTVRRLFLAVYTTADGLSSLRRVRTGPSPRPPVDRRAGGPDDLFIFKLGFSLRKSLQPDPRWYVRIVGKRSRHRVVGLSVCPALVRAGHKLCSGCRMERLVV